MWEFSEILGVFVSWRFADGLAGWRGLSTILVCLKEGRGVGRMACARRSVVRLRESAWKLGRV
jgi:hypothetical protein